MARVKYNADEYINKEEGKLTFFLSRQIVNPHILGLVSLSQIRKSPMCASPKIANPQIFMINPQTTN
jgi:hypothetical protein